MFFFLGFSGLDVIGSLLTGNVGFHLEWWAYYIQFSSMITQLFWVFNQIVVPWIIIFMFLDEKKVDKYLLLILLCLPYGPLPFLGFIPLMGVRGIKILVQSIKKQELKKFIKDVFSLDNIFAFIAIFPIYLAYYRSNSAVSGDGSFGTMIDYENLLLLFVFLFLEVGIYGIILFRENKNNEVFISALISLMIIPLFKIGHTGDFSMRVSIPSLLVIDICFVKFILKELENNNFSKIRILKLTIILCVFELGFITPFFEFLRAFAHVGASAKINLVADDIITLSNKNLNDYANFVCKNPKENSIFFKYIAK